VVEAGEVVAQVGEDAESFVVVFDDEGGAFAAVVGGGDGVDGGGVEAEGGAGAEVVGVVDAADFGGAGVEGAFGDVEGQVEFSVEDAGTAGVVAVVVCDEKGVDIVDVTLVLDESFLGGFSGEAGVDE